MSDVFSKRKRSEVMQSVKSKGNKSTEGKFIEILKENNITGWKRHYKMLGNPDFAFPKLRIVVFIDGCFWHGHNCRNTQPSDNFQYWEKKIKSNISRDAVINKTLTNKGWLTIRIWECELQNELVIENVRSILKNSFEDDLD